MKLITSSPRLNLRVWQPEADLQAALQLWQDPQVMQYIENGQPYSQAQIEKALQVSWQHQQKYGCQIWALELKASGQVIGCCGFSVYEGGPALELVYHLLPSHWGQGFASEAAQAAIDYARQHLQPPRIVAGVHPDNPASHKVLQKLGFCDCGLVWFEDSQAYEPFYELLL